MKNKILITGTGRSGTSLLVKLFSHLHMETGFSINESNQIDYAKCNAGLEIRDLTRKDVRIFKAPHFAIDIENILKEKEGEIQHIIIPIRDLDSSAKSRERIGGDGYKAGGFFYCKNFQEQRKMNAELIYSLFYNLSLTSIGYTLLPFPLFAKNSNIIYDRLKWLFEEYDISFSDYNSVFDRVVDLSKVHFQK